MSAPVDLAFVACIEAGVLERQALLLFESIRAYGGALADSPIYALAPRAGQGVVGATRHRLEALQVEYIDLVLNSDCPEYGSANRVVAAAHIEETRTHDILVVLDSDTLVLRDPEAFRLPEEVDVAVRPVDYKGICTAGPHDPFERYWRRLCEICGVGYDEIPWIESYVDRARVKASYNGGLVVARSARGILRRWREFFLASIRAELRPRAEPVSFRSSTGTVAAAASRLWGSNQAALSLAMWSTTRRVLTLDPSYNYPLHAHTALGERRVRNFDRLVHVHYHWLFEPDAIAAAPITASTSTLAGDKLAWLRARTPLRAGRDAEPTHVRPARRLTVERPTGSLTPPLMPLASRHRPLVVVGMHRSGTSLTASILGSAGLHLGDSLVPASRSNVAGYFEDREFVSLHRAALDTLGHDPEGLDEVVLDHMPDEFMLKVRALLEARASRPLWGWKDPRTALFLPFWERLLPEARFVFVYRDPWEVIDSLYRRGDDRFGHDPVAAARLWSHYNRAILDAQARMPGRSLLFKLGDVATDPAGFVEQVGRAFDIRLGPPADLYRPHLLHRGDRLADWRALSASVLSPQIDLLGQLDAAAHRLGGQAPATKDPASPAILQGALLRQWRALRRAERPPTTEAPLRLYIPVQGVYSEHATLVDVLQADGETRDFTFRVPYDGSAPLRVDVGETVGIIELEAVTIRSRESGVAASWSGASLQSAFRMVNAVGISGRGDERFCCLSLNDDPQLFVDPPDRHEFQGTWQVDISVGFRALTDEAVQRAAAALLRELTTAAAASAAFRAHVSDLERLNDGRIHQSDATIETLNRRLARSSEALESSQATIRVLQQQVGDIDERWQRAQARLESNDAVLAEMREKAVRRGLELDTLREALAKSEQRLGDVAYLVEWLRQSRAYRFGRLLFDPFHRAESAAAAPATGVNGGRPVSYSDLACLAQTPLFDTEFYVSANPDVRIGNLEPRMHYLCSGAAEGRDPSPWFKTAFYLAEYPDVAAAGINPLVHYVTIGAQEGRLPRPVSDRALPPSRLSAEA
jgi:uncharacterized coiled-coil protein SlyX